MVKKMSTAVGWITSLILGISTISAQADVTLTMSGWDVLPRVQIAQDNGGDCEANQIIFDGPITKPYSRTFPVTGTNGADICVRRTRDPRNVDSPLDDTWTRCSSDGACEIH